MGIGFFLAGWGLGFTVYVILQVAAVLALRTRTGRKFALAPAPFMLVVFLWTTYAYQIESNLWPLVLIFTAPMAAFAVIVLWVAMAVVERGDRLSRPAN